MNARIPEIVITLQYEAAPRMDFNGDVGDEERLIDWLRSQPLLTEIVALASIAVGIDVA